MPKLTLFDNEKNLPSPFIPAKRVDIIDYLRSGGDLKRDVLAKLIEKHCVQDGKPLVIGNIHKLPAWDDELFNVENLGQIYPKDRIELFNMKTRESTQRHTINDYIKKLDPKNVEKQLPGKARYKAEAKKKQNNFATMATKTTNTFVNHGAPQQDEQLTAESKRRTRRNNNSSNKKTIQQNNIYYAKDLSCPTAYKEKITQLLPDYLLPLGSYDLFDCMPDELRAENLMCYVGGDATGTSLHRDICGTMGHNLMSYGEEGAFAEWYFIENQHRDALLSTFHPRKQKGTNNEVEDENDEELAEQERMENRKSSFIESDRAWVNRGPLKKTGFQTQVSIQRPGDLVIIPSLCYHQVRNVKTSVKIAWNRATARTLQFALENQLPIYQSLVRPEIYRCKAMVYYSLQRYREKLWALQTRNSRSKGDTTRFLDDIRILLELFAKYVIHPEMIQAIPEEGIDGIENNIKVDHCIDEDAKEYSNETDSESKLYTIVCDFCCADIFNRHYRCLTCDRYDLCLSCYSQGRGCEHLDQLTMYQARQSIQFYMDFYLTILQSNEELLPFLRQPPFKHEMPNNGSTYSLATTCQRIENYRKTNRILSTYLICGHCESIATFPTLYQEYGLDPFAIFNRKRCTKLPQDPNSNIVYTCKECTNQCEDGCHPFPVSTKEMTEKVYYYAPQNNPRNWGGPADVGIYNTSYWPDRRSVSKFMKKKSLVLDIVSIF
ncbi:hypothetical protein BDC45DRAFT_132826 [Circinella umbellata]|nr:hypothetical protein BDC45DRAFT_132826 [Circinella umbellata]